MWSPSNFHGAEASKYGRLVEKSGRTCVAKVTCDGKQGEIEEDASHPKIVPYWRKQRSITSNPVYYCAYCLCHEFSMGCAAATAKVD